MITARAIPTAPVATPPVPEPEAKRALWLDPVRWSWLVRSYGLFLVVTTLAEYMAVLMEVLDPWLPDYRPQGLRGLMLLGWLVLPFVLSQAFTIVSMLLVRVRHPEDSQATKIACSAIASLPSNVGRWRSPRLLTGNVADPRLVSVFGMPFLVLPRQGARLFVHMLGDDRGVRAFHAAVLHEMGHVELWDDLLFFPALVYLTCGFGLDLFGIGLAMSDRLSWHVPLGHSILLVGLALIATYVVRRREAYADAFAAVVDGSEGPIRLALGVLQDSARPRSVSLVSLHFAPERRLAWLDARGRPFLDMSMRDLAFLALVNLTVGVRPLSQIPTISAASSIIISMVNGSTEIAVDILSILAIIGLVIGRRGMSPSYRELFSAAGLCALGGIAHEVLRLGVANLYGIAMVVYNATFAFGFKVLPFVVIVRVLCRWSIALLSRSKINAREQLVGAVTLLVIIVFLFDQVLGLILRAIGAGIIPSITKPSPDTAQLISSSVSMLLLLLLQATGYALIFAALSRWSTHALANAPVISCKYCGTSPPQGGSTPVFWVTCPSCGAPLRRDVVVELASDLLERR